MSKSSVQQVIQRAVSDAAFRRQLQREPAKALAGFDLTAEERASVTGGDPARLTALGVDQRMSKAFALGAAADASTSVNASSIDSAGTSGSAAFIDEASAAGGTPTTDGIIGDATSGAASAFASDPTAGATGTVDVSTGDATTGATLTADAMVDTGGPVLDAGFVSDPTSGTAGIIPDPGTAGVSAFEDMDTTGDMNSIDPGLVESSDPQIAGTQVTIDDGQPSTDFLTEN